MSVVCLKHRWARTRLFFLFLFRVRAGKGHSAYLARFLKSKQVSENYLTPYSFKCVSGLGRESPSHFNLTKIFGTGFKSHLQTLRNSLENPKQRLVWLVLSYGNNLEETSFLQRMAPQLAARSSPVVWQLICSNSAPKTVCPPSGGHLLILTAPLSSLRNVLWDLCVMELKGFDWIYLSSIISNAF